MLLKDPSHVALQKLLEGSHRFVCFSSTIHKGMARVFLRCEIEAVWHSGSYRCGIAEQDYLYKERNSPRLNSI